MPSEKRNSIIAKALGLIFTVKAYWHMNFSLINGCGTRDDKIRNYSFF